MQNEKFKVKNAKWNAAIFVSITPFPLFGIAYVDAGLPTRMSAIQQTGSLRY
jgi:hypothetical protein